MSNKVANSEIRLSGSPGCPGIVIGMASKYRRQRPAVSDKQIEDEQFQEHIDKFHDARKKAEQELRDLVDEQESANASELVNTQIEMLNDPDLIERVEKEITANHSAVDTAVKNVFESYLAVIRNNFEDAKPERSVDIADVQDRLIQILHDHQDDITEGTILVAEELSPREVIECSARNIKGIVTDHGGSTSHAAIIARSMNIPMVVGLKDATKQIDSDDHLIVDGRNGEVILAPQQSTCERYRQLQEEQMEANRDFQRICKQPNQTSDGTGFSLKANIEFLEELESVDKFCAEGIGLLRTESIYLNQENFRDQKQQESFYTSILDATDPYPVTIRLFDAGGDKFFEEGDKEQNPFLGWRGIRMLLGEKSLLRNQLTAILKVAGRYPGRVRILVPMISTLEELIKVKELMLQVQGQLMEEGIAVDKQIELGIMVEVPSVAMQAGLFAKHADFLSIGTNDLTQYMLAVDRGNERIASLYNQRHPVIWKLINQVAKATDEQGIPLSVCGELASDPIAACCLVGMGIRDLSMNPVLLPSVKQMLRAYSSDELQQLTNRVLSCDTLDDINEIFSNWQRKDSN